MTPRQRLTALLDELAIREKPVRIVKKSQAWHQRAAARALFLLTFGGQRTYLTHYVTTLGHAIYVPDNFHTWEPSDAWRILKHELIHVAQFERYGWLIMTIVYGFFPLPAGLAYGRARLEWEAYAETLRATAEIDGVEAARDPKLHDRIIRRFTGPDYGWMWPFPQTIRLWIADEMARIEASYST